MYLYVTAYIMLYAAIEPTARQGSCCPEEAEEMLCLEMAPAFNYLDIFLDPMAEGLAIHVFSKTEQPL